MAEDRPRLRLNNPICFSRSGQVDGNGRHVIIQIRDLRETINTANTRLKSDPRAKVIADAGEALDTKMTEIEEVLIQTKAKSGQDVLNFPVRLNNHLVALSGVVGSADWLLRSSPTRYSICSAKRSMNNWQNGRRFSRPMWRHITTW